MSRETRYWTPQTSPSSGGMGLADGPVPAQSLSLATIQLPALSSSRTRWGEPWGPSDGAEAAPSRTVILATPETHLRSPLLPSTVASVSAVSRAARIGIMTAATVHASLAGDGVMSDVPPHAARARQASAAGVRKATVAAVREISIEVLTVQDGTQASTRFRGVRRAIAFICMEVMNKWT